ncbi:LacI family DNA-binding transcriptional regulator [Luteimicrobium album]|uniref:LacI family DNA-binding transcriptional regulator n=1 Tax=Luteimicrobium album TaxID=1054550 RepID=UPI0024E1568A|nr:LacI family DNA-binding transcriptional regulator [Luteimicrobium album]
MRRRPTQADVARQAGVSVSIVSAVINDRQYGNIRVSDATRQRVRKAVQELGYAPNLAARGLAGGTNRLIGVFTFQRIFPLAKEDFFYEFLVGVEEAAEEEGYNLLLLTAAKDKAGQRSLYPEGTNGMQLADGGVLAGWDESADEIRRLAAEAYPFVFIGRREIPGVELSYVAADYRSATRELTDRILRSGRTVAFVRGSSAPELVPGRQQGFREALGASPTNQRDDATFATLPPEPSLLDYAQLVTWASEHSVDCLLVENSRHAVGVDEVARSRPSGARLQVLSLGGAPEEEAAARLGGLVIPRREMGREAVRLLVRLITEPGAGPQRTTLPVEVHVPA